MYLNSFIPNVKVTQHRPWHVCLTVKGGFQNDHNTYRNSPVVSYGRPPRTLPFCLYIEAIRPCMSTVK
jgi:hypothetical protein